MQVLSKSLSLFPNKLKNLVKMSTYPIENVLKVLEDFAPLDSAESWDNVGLLVEPFNYKDVKKIMLTNDLTENVMNEVVKTQSNFVITYHPLIFSGLKRITQSDWKTRIISQCFAQGIAIFSPHTSWDAAENGVNKWLIDAITSNHANLRPITPNAKYPNLGGGKQCSLVNPMSISQAISNLKNYSGINNVQVGLGLNKKMESEVKTLAVCAGSGASVLRAASEAPDLFITGEMSHHEVLEATHKGTTCILMNHSNSERFFLKTFKEILDSKLPDISVCVSVEDEDPLKTY